MPLHLIDELTTTFIERGLSKPTKQVISPDYFFDCTQLLIMCALEHLWGRRHFCQFKIKTELSPEEHQHFYRIFINKLSNDNDEWIFYPKSMRELSLVMKDYQDNFLPGCGGSLKMVLLPCW